MKTKSVIVMIAVLTCAIVSAGCSTPNTNTSSVLSKNSSSAVSSSTSSSKESTPKSTSSDTSSIKEESSQAESKAKETKSITLGEKVLVTTGSGKFYVTFDKLKRDSDDNTTALLDCTINNIDFKDKYNDTFYLENYMNVTDEKNFVVKTAGSGNDDGNYLMWTEVPKGTNARIVVPYNIQKTNTSLTFKINEQYVLKANIE